MFLLLYLKKNCNYSFLNRFFYQSVNELPKIKKIILNFKLNNYNLKLIAAHFLVLQQLTDMNKGSFLKAKKSGVLIKIKKGDIIGCEFSIRTTKQVLVFIKKFIREILINKQQNVNSSNVGNQSISYQIGNVNLLTRFDNFFSIYNCVNKSHLNLIITFSFKKNELLDLLNKLKLT